MRLVPVLLIAALPASSPALAKPRTPPSPAPAETEAPPLTDASLESAPSPGPSSSVVPLVPVSQDALTGIPEATVRKCLEVTNRWQDFAAQAQGALAECLFHRFHRACEEARKISEAEKGPHAVCRQVMEKKKIKFPEMSCVFVQVPGNCGKE